MRTAVNVDSVSNCRKKRELRSYEVRVWQSVIAVILVSTAGTLKGLWKLSFHSSNFSPPNAKSGGRFVANGNISYILKLRRILIFHAINDYEVTSELLATIYRFLA